MSDVNDTNTENYRLLLNEVLKRYDKLNMIKMAILRNNVIKVKISKFTFYVNPNDLDESLRIKISNFIMRDEKTTEREKILGQLKKLLFQHPISGGRFLSRQISQFLQTGELDTEFKEKAKKVEEEEIKEKITEVMLQGKKIFGYKSKTSEFVITEGHLETKKGVYELPLIHALKDNWPWGEVQQGISIYRISQYKGIQLLAYFDAVSVVQSTIYFFEIPTRQFSNPFSFLGKIYKNIRHFVFWQNKQQNRINYLSPVVYLNEKSEDFEELPHYNYLYHKDLIEKKSAIITSNFVKYPSRTNFRRLKEELLQGLKTEAPKNKQ